MNKTTHLFILMYFQKEKIGDSDLNAFLIGFDAWMIMQKILPHIEVFSFPLNHPATQMFWGTN